MEGKELSLQRLFVRLPQPAAQTQVLSLVSEVSSSSPVSAWEGTESTVTSPTVLG